MKRLLVLLVLMVAGNLVSVAQTLSYSSIKNQDLTYVLNNLQKLTSYTDRQDLFIQVYSVTDPSKSAHIEGDDEVTNSIYIAVSEDGESPEQHLYKLSSVYNPKFVSWARSPAGPKLVLSYGPANKRRTASITVSLRKLVVN